MRQSLQDLIECYQNNLYTAAFNVCKNAEDAQDVVQDTFVQYYTRKKELDYLPRGCRISKYFCCDSPRSVFYNITFHTRTSASLP